MLYFLINNVNAKSTKSLASYPVAFIHGRELTGEICTFSTIIHFHIMLFFPQ